MDKNKIGIVILAAGDGKRMQSTIPKVMTLLQGKPLVEHLVETAEATSFPKEITVVVNPKHTLVQDHLGARAQYIVQEQQLGTGHAAAMAEPLLSDKVDHVVVLYGDMPSLRATSIDRMVDEHTRSGNVMTLMTATVPDFGDWREIFYKNFGRIIRDENGKVLKSVEFKDANDEEKKSQELNPCFYCFQTVWLFKSLKNLKNDNVQKEYYLTDLLRMVLQNSDQVSSVSIEPEETFGINSKEDLDIVSRFLA